MNVDRAALLQVINTELEHRITDSLNDSIETMVEENFVDIDRLENVTMASQKKSTLQGLFDLSISRMFESGQLDSCSETRLSSIAYLTLFTDYVI